MGKGGEDAERDESGIPEDALEAGLRLGFREAVSPVPGAGERGAGPPGGVLLRDIPEEEAPLLRVEERPPGDDGRIDGRYQVVGEIARGAVGVIYKVRDLQLGRDVVLKVLREDRAGDRPLVERFVEEAQIEAQLQHPGMVPVYGIGVQGDGRPYIAMKLVKGRTLSALLRDRRDPSQDRRRFTGIFERLCQAIAYAHARGVIHRDLKPSNVLVGAFGEVQVVDWGFAKVLGARERPAPQPRPPADRSVIRTIRTGSEGSGSVAGSVMGTPAYMPPEQALGEVAEVDARSDVFALGAILCEILTGKPPYVGQEGELLPMAAQGRLEDAHARLASCGADPGLVELCWRALAPMKRDRPDDAGALARAAAEHLAELEDQARKAEVAAAEGQALAEEDRLREEAEHRARRRTLVLGGVLLAAAVLGGGGMLWRESARRARAGEAAGRVEEVLARAAAHSAAGELPAALAAAREAIALAEAGEAPPESAERARVLAAGFQDRVDREAAARAREERDLQMRTTLEEIRLRAGEDMDLRRMVADMAAAFRDYGIDVTVLPAEESGAAVRASAIMEDLVGALDTWFFLPARSAVREEQAKAEALRQKVGRVVRAADPDGYRMRLRQAAAEENLDLLRRLAEEADFDRLPARTAWLLGSFLWNLGEADPAQDLLQRAQLRYPDDIWINGLLVTVSLRRDRPDYDDAIRYALAGMAARPSAGIRLSRSIATTLDAKLDPDGAQVWYEAAEGYARRVVEKEPTRARAWSWLGWSLDALGRTDEAVAAHEKALALDPTAPDAWMNLAAVRLYLEDWDGARIAYEKALEQAPWSHDLLLGLGSMHLFVGDFDRAREYFRSAADLVLAETEVTLNHGEQCFQSVSQSLQFLGDDEANLKLTGEWTRRTPASPLAWYGHGWALLAARKAPEAEAAFRRCTEKSPWWPHGYLGLEHALLAQDRVRDALAAYAAHLRLAREPPSCTCAIWRVAQEAERAGDLQGALAAYFEVEQRWSIRQQYELKRLEVYRGMLSGSARTRRFVAERLRELEQQETWFRKMESGIRGKRELYPLALRGEAHPTDPKDLYLLAEIEALRGLCATAAGITDEVFRADPSLKGDAVSGDVLWAAQLACRAAAGEGRDAGDLDAAGRAVLRRKGLGWLREVLELAREKVRSDDSLLARQQMRGLAVFLQSPQYRESNWFPLPGETKDLPADEREAWEAYWKDLDAFLRSTWKGGKP